MAIAVTPLGAAAVDGGFGGASPWAAATGVTLGTGDVVVFARVDNGLGQTVTGVTVGGLSGTQLGVTADNLGSAWLCQGVTTATGNVSIAFSGSYNLVGANWFRITGENTSPVFSFVDNTGFSSPDPVTVTPSGAGVPAGGVGLVAIGCDGFGGTNRNPTTWTGCIASGNTTLEAAALTGNGTCIAGNYTTTPGTGALTGSSANSYAGTNTEIMALAFSASGGGGGTPWLPGEFGNVPGFTRNIGFCSREVLPFRLRRGFMGWRQERSVIRRPSLVLPGRSKRAA